VQREDNDPDKTTVTIHRDALLGLIDKSVAPPAPLAHTVSREQLRSRAVTRDEALDKAVAEPPPVEPLDMDLTPPLSPWLVAAVIALLLVVFIAATHLH
jgi:hypothetical protein